MARGARIRRLLRWLVRGRSDGLRASLRRRCGFREEAPTSPPPPAAPEAPPEPAVLDGWTVVVPDDELHDGEVIEAMVGDRALALVRVGEEVFALDDLCPHAGGPLGDGTLDGCELTCPWHGWTFDVRTGACTMDPSLEAGTLEAKRHDGHVYVRA